MNTLPTLFLKNDALDAEIEAFCASDSEFLKIRQEFYQTADEIAALVGSDRYDAFERNFGAYLCRTADLHYLYGLGLRQEILQAMGAGG